MNPSEPAAAAETEDRERGPLHEAAIALRLDRVRDARELYRQALATAPHFRARAEALEGLGYVAYRSGRPREAVQLLEESLALLGAPAAERPALAETLGRAHAELGELDEAVAVFEACRQRFRREGDRVNEIRFAGYLGYALTDRGRFAEAETVLSEALEAGAGLGDPLTRARLCWAQARLRGEQGQTEAAAEHARAALDVLADTEHAHFLAQTYELLASLYIDLGRSEEALALLREGWPLLLNNSTPLEVAHYRIEEARALAALGQSEGAAAIAMRVAAQLDGTLPGDVGRAYVLLGEIFDALGDVDRARELYEEAIVLLEGQGPSRYLAAAYSRLGALFEAEYRTKDALAALKRAVAVQNRVRRTDRDGSASA